MRNFRDGGAQRFSTRAVVRRNERTPSHSFHHAVEPAASLSLLGVAYVWLARTAFYFLRRPLVSP